jgi:hypothetical protein
MTPLSLLFLLGVVLCCHVHPAAAAFYNETCHIAGWPAHECPHRDGKFLKENAAAINCAGNNFFRTDCTDAQCCEAPDPQPRMSAVCKRHCEQNISVYSSQNDCATHTWGFSSNEVSADMPQCMSQCEHFMLGRASTDCVKDAREDGKGVSMADDSTQNYIMYDSSFIGCAYGVGLSRKAATCLDFCNSQQLFNGVNYCKNYCAEFEEARPASCKMCHSVQLTPIEAAQEKEAQGWTRDLTWGPFWGVKNNCPNVWKQQACQIACNWVMGNAIQIDLRWLD